MNKTAKQSNKPKTSKKSNKPKTAKKSNKPEKSNKPKKSNKSKKFRIKNFKSWSFGTINIQSGHEKNEGAKIYSVAKEVAKANLAFCCLQEVRWRNTGSKIITLNTGERFEFHWAGYKKKREAGTGILIRIDPNIEINSPNINDARVMGIDLKINGFNIRVVNAYAPTETSGTTSQKQSFYSLLSKAIQKNHKHQKLIVLGDFNATTSIAKHRCFFDGKKIITDPECNDNGDRLKSFCRSNLLHMSNTFFKHRMLHRYTWYSNDGITRKVIDYILVEKYVQNYMTDCRVYRGINIDSDHRLLKATMCTPATRKARKRYNKNPAPPGRCVKALLNPTTQMAYTTAVDEKLGNLPQTENIDTISERLIKVLNEAANITLPKKKKIESTREIWKDDELLNILLLERGKSQRGSQVYRTLTKKIKKRVNKLRNDKMKQEAEEINQFATNREVEELFRSFKSDGSTFKTTKRKNGCDQDKLKKYFEKHFSHSAINNPEPDELTNTPQFIRALQTKSFDHINMQPPDKKEIKSTLNSLKNGKSSSDIPAEFIKYASSSECLLSELHELLHQIWTTQNVPASWGHSKLIALWKGSSKGSAKDPSTYRGLQVGSTLCKIMVIIILKRLSDWYDTHLLDQQQGFRRGRGTSDGIYITKRIQQISDKIQKPIYLLFIDLSSAFDHVIREWLFKSIYQRFPPNSDITMIKLLEALYNYTTTALAENPDDIFQLLSGVRQGGPESPPLYNLYMDYVMRVFMDTCQTEGIKFQTLRYRIRATATTREDRQTQYQGDHTIDWSGYADDLMLVFENTDELQKALIILNNTFMRFHLQINIAKTKTMIVNSHQHFASYPATICKLNGIPIENVKKFRYLGDDIQYDQPTTGDAEVDLRISVAENKFNQLYKKLTNKNIKLQWRVMIFNSMVRSRLTYSCQTWNLNKQQQQRIRSCYNTMLRKMIRRGFERRNRDENDFSFIITNDDVLRICKTEDVITYTEKQQTKYLAHIARRSNDNTAKRLLFNDNKNRKRGRPIKTLEQYVLESNNTTALKSELEGDGRIFKNGRC